MKVLGEYTGVHVRDANFLHSGPAGDGRASPVARGVRMYCNRPVHAFPRDHYCSFQNVTLPF